MTAPAHQVLGLVRGMLLIDRAQAKAAGAFDAAGSTTGADPGGGGVMDPDHADRIADALAEAEARYGPIEVTL